MLGLLVASQVIPPPEEFNRPMVVLLLIWQLQIFGLDESYKYIPPPLDTW